jgi:hypothetical protein
MKLKVIGLILLTTLLTMSCNKNEGPGGTSTIKGKLVGVNHSFGESEVTQVLFTNGTEVEHGDYWLLNSPSTNNYFYIWYNNPIWTSPGNPFLSGRIGIQVDFNYYDSNVEIASNTMDSILAVTSAFDIVILNDILEITNTQTGETPDAIEVTSPFEIDIKNQGETGSLGPQNDLANEKIYLVYGDNEFYDDDIQTGVNGIFEFKGLQVGNYSVYVYSKDTITGSNTIVDIPVEITDKKSVTDIGEIDIVY